MDYRWRPISKPNQTKLKINLMRLVFPVSLWQKQYRSLLSSTLREDLVLVPVLDFDVENVL